MILLDANCFYFINIIQRVKNVFCVDSISNPGFSNLTPCITQTHALHNKNFTVETWKVEQALCYQKERHIQKVKSFKKSSINQRPFFHRVFYEARLKFQKTRLSKNVLNRICTSS